MLFFKSYLKRKSGQADESSGESSAAPAKRPRQLGPGAPRPGWSGVPSSSSPAPAPVAAMSVPGAWPEEDLTDHVPWTSSLIPCPDFHVFKAPSASGPVPKALVLQASDGQGTPGRSRPVQSSTPQPPSPASTVLGSHSLYATIPVSKGKARATDPTILPIPELRLSDVLAPLSTPSGTYNSTFTSGAGDLLATLLPLQSALIPHPQNPAVESTRAPNPIDHRQPVAEEAFGLKVFAEGKDPVVE